VTGPEHYREAERLIDEANHVGHHDPQRGDGILIAAQVHATLALAAATALLPFANVDSGMPDLDLDGWREVAGTPPHCARYHGEADGPCEAAAGGHGAFNCPGCVAADSRKGSST
jgi:hypothetical protein